MISAQEISQLVDAGLNPEQLKIVTKILEKRGNKNGNVTVTTRNADKQRRYRENLEKSKDLVTNSGNVTVTQENNPYIDHASAPDSLSLDLKKVSKKRKDTKRKETPYSPEFGIFWVTYPKNHGSKFDAWQSYQKALGLGVTPTALANAAGKYAAQCVTEGTEEKYTAHPATWLNQRRWEGNEAGEPPPGYRNGNTTGKEFYDNPANRMPSVAGG